MNKCHGTRRRQQRMARQKTAPKHSPRQPIIVKPEQALPITPFGLEMKVRKYSSSSRALMSSPSAAKPRRSDPAPLSSSRAMWCTASRTWGTPRRACSTELAGRTGPLLQGNLRTSGGRRFRPCPSHARRPGRSSEEAETAMRGCVLSSRRRCLRPRVISIPSPANNKTQVAV